MTDIERYEFKENLLKDISALFLKYGLRSTSMEDICKHLKISKKTLYQMFSNKEDVVEQVIMYRRNSQHTQQVIKSLKEMDPIRMMLTIRDHIITHFNGEITTNMFDLKKYHPDVYKRIKISDQKFIENFFNDIIDKGIDKGYFRKNINKEIQVYLFVRQMALLSDPELFCEIKYPINIIVSSIVENILRSFVTPEGMILLDRFIEKRNNTFNKS